MGINYEIITASTREEYKTLIYPKEDGTHSVDLVLDGVNDFYLAESNGYKISDPYLTNEIALVSSKKLSSEPTKVAIPDYAVISTSLSEIYALKEVTYTSTMEEAIELVKSGKVEAAYLPNASAKHFVEADPTNSIYYTIVNGYSDSYVISVCSSYSHLLVGAINRTVNSLSTEYVSGVVAENEDLPIPF